MDALDLSRADSLPLAARADSLPLAALLGAVDVVSPRRAAQAAALAAASPSSPSAAHGAAGVAPPSPSEHYRRVAAQRASDARSFIALVAGRFPRGTRVYDNFTRALAVYAKSAKDPAAKDELAKEVDVLFAGKASDLCVKFRREFYEPSVARVSPPRAAPLEPAVDFRGSDPPKRKAPAPAKEKLMIPTFAPPDEPAAGRRVSAASVLHELGGGEDPDDETLDDMRAKAKKARG